MNDLLMCENCGHAVTDHRGNGACMFIVHPVGDHEIRKLCDCNDGWFLGRVLAKVFLRDLIADTIRESLGGRGDPFRYISAREVADAVVALPGLAMRCETCEGRGQVERTIGADQCMACSGVGFVVLR